MTYPTRNYGDDSSRVYQGNTGAPPSSRRAEPSSQRRINSLIKIIATTEPLLVAGHITRRALPPVAFACRLGAACVVLVYILKRCIGFSPSTHSGPGRAAREQWVPLQREEYPQTQGSPTSLFNERVPANRPSDLWDSPGPNAPRTTPYGDGSGSSDHIQNLRQPAKIKQAV